MEKDFNDLLQLTLGNRMFSLLDIVLYAMVQFMWIAFSVHIVTRYFGKCMEKYCWGCPDGSLREDAVKGNACVGKDCGVDFIRGKCIPVSKWNGSVKWVFAFVTVVFVGMFAYFTFCPLVEFWDTKISADYIVNSFAVNIFTVGLLVFSVAVIAFCVYILYRDFFVLRDRLRLVGRIEF